MSKYSKLLSSVSAMITLFICGCTSEEIAQTNKPTIVTTGNPELISDERKSNVESNYDALNNIDNVDNHFQIIDIESFNGKIANNESFVVFFGSTESKICQIAVEYINQAGIKTDSVIFSVDTSQGTSEEALNIVYESLSNYLVEKDYEKYLQIPSLFLIKDGTVIKEHIGLIDDSEGDLTESQQKDLVDSYIEMMETIK